METYKKLGLAARYNTTADVLRELAKEDNWDIKYRVAGHPNTPDDILCNLAKDEDCWIRGEVAINPKSSIKVIVMLFEREKNLKKPAENVITALYNNSKLPYVAKIIIETLFRKML